MKKIALLLIICSLFFISCKKCYQCTLSRKVTSDRHIENNALLPANSSTTTTVCDMTSRQINQAEKSGTYTNTNVQVIGNETYTITTVQVYSCR